MKYCALIASLMVAARSQAPPTVDESVLASYVSLYEVDPTALSCDDSMNDTAACDNIGFTCTNNVCTPGCTEAADCDQFGTGTGFNTCDNGVCTFDDTAACTTDDDCPTIMGYTCNTTTNLCEAPAGCTSNDDCQMAGLGLCSSGMCVPEQCTVSADCLSANFVCGPAGVCVPDCNADNTACTDQGLSCDTDSGLCTAACSQDSDCGGFTNMCHTSGMCIPGCMEDSDCSVLGYLDAICNENGQCVPNGCIISSDCEDSEICVPLTGRCVANPTAGECSSDADCNADNDAFTCAGPSGYRLCVVDCTTDDDCVAAGFNQACGSQTVDVPLVGSQTINYCDPLQPLPEDSTAAPTSSPTETMEEGTTMDPEEGTTMDPEEGTTMDPEEGTTMDPDEATTMDEEATTDEAMPSTTEDDDDDETGSSAANQMALWSVCATLVASYLFV